MLLQMDTYGQAYRYFIMRILQSRIAVLQDLLHDKAAEHDKNSANLHKG